MLLKEKEIATKVESLEAAISKYRKGSVITRIMKWDKGRYLIEAPASYPDTGNPYYIFDNGSIHPFTPTVDFEKFDYARNHVIVRRKTIFDKKIGD